MKLSTKSKYGVRAMVALASSGNKTPLSINVISKMEGISACYLEQLFIFLKNGNLIKSTRGAKGGYVLARKPEEITVGEILNLLEGPIEIADCTDGIPCSRIEKCASKVLWKKVKKSIEDVLNSITLQDILNDYNKINYKGIEILDRSDITHENSIFR
ncbi:MAG: RrF2 family transcriptional regulator [Clostridium sp.]